MKRLDLTGNVFGKLTVLNEAGKTSNGQALWLCECECGVLKVIRLSSLRGGVSRSCGCGKFASNLGTTTHGASTSRAYRVWTNMKQRCENPNSQAWDNYGGRGITVCPEWSASFERFLADMGEPPIGLSLDRIDNNSGYCLQNCRWATREQQANNARRFPRYGEKTQEALSAELGISIKAVRIRQRAGKL